VSLNPIRQTLEDFFVRHVTAPDVVAADRFSHPDRTSAATAEGTRA
jgi:hypothetical protein